MNTNPPRNPQHDHPGRTAGRRWLQLLAGAAMATGLLAGVATPSGSSTPSSNLLVGDQAGFGTSTGGWVAYGATLAQVASPSDQDPGALEVTATSSSPSSTVSAWSGAPAPYPGYPAPTSGTTPSPNLTAATPGLVYSGSAQVMPAAGGTTETVAPALGFWDASGKPLGYVPGTQSQVAAGSWSSTTTATALAPPGAAYVALAVELRNSTGQWSLDVDDAVLTGQSDTAAPVAGPLHTSGTRILDPSGNPVVPRGIDYTGLESSASPADLNQQTFASLHSWGATLVRISLNEDLWLSTSCAYDPRYQQAVAQAVQWATSLGMVALLDLHLSNPADIGATSSCPAQVPQIMADAPGSDAFWTAVAKQYRSNPLVAFDLFNEPHWITGSVWRNGGKVSGFAAQGMQQLYNDVRKAGARNLVFAEGFDWADTPPAAYMLTGYNIVYDAHDYTCPNYAPPQCSYNGNPYDPGPGLAPWVTFQAQQQVPVFVGEFGWPSTYDGTYNQNVVTDADSHGWGWVAWEYGGTVGRAFDLVATLPSSGTMEPSPSGMPILADLASHSPPVVTTAAVAPSSSGYVLAASDGGVFAFGAPFLGSLGGTRLHAPIEGVAESPSTGGYWLVAADGGVFAFGDAPFLGSMGGTQLASPVVAMATDPVTGAYWLVASDGGVFAFGDAAFEGSMGGTPLNKPIVAMAATPDGEGYWLVAADGGVFAFGDAAFEGSMGGTPLNEPIVAMAATPDGEGYWLVAADGGVFAFGDAAFEGSMGSSTLNAPITAMACSEGGDGYWLVGGDGGIFALGDAPFEESLGDVRLVEPIVGATSWP